MTKVFTAAGVRVPCDLGCAFHHPEYCSGGAEERWRENPLCGWNPHSRWTGLAKKFVFFQKMTWKNTDKLFSQPSTYRQSIELKEQLKRNKTLVVAFYAFFFFQLWFYLACEHKPVWLELWPKEGDRTADQPVKAVVLTANICNDQIRPLSPPLCSVFSCISENVLNCHIVKSKYWASSQGWWYSEKIDSNPYVL